MTGRFIRNAVVRIVGHQSLPWSGLRSQLLQTVEGCAMQALGSCVLLLALAQAGWAQTPQGTGQPTQKLIQASINTESGVITVGQTSYSPSNSGNVHLVALERTTLKLLDAADKTFANAADINDFLTQLRKGKNADAILMATGFGGSNVVPGDIAPMLQQFGLEKEAKLSTASDFYFLGNGGLDPGQARVGLAADGSRAGGPDGTMRGYFAENSEGDYSFIQPNYIAYSIKPDGTVQVGARSYTSAIDTATKTYNCDKATPNFHMVTVSAVEPQSLIENEVFCHAPESLADSLLQAAKKEGAYLIFLASCGPSPFPTTPGTPEFRSIVSLGFVLKDLGGYPETFFWSKGDDHYEFVSSPAQTTHLLAPAQAQEGGSVYPGDAKAGLQGILGRSLVNNYYVPINADLTGQVNLGLYNLLSLPPKPFPHPDTPAELTAFQQINMALCGSKDCNVRNAYGNLNQPISDYQIRLAALKDPTNPTSDCPASASPGTTPFCTVKIQLQTEFSDVASVRALYGNVHDLWLGSGTEGILSLLAVYQQVKDSAGANDGAASREIGVGLAELMLGLGSEVPGAGKALGIAEAVMRLAIPLAADANGNPTAELETTVGKLEEQARTTFTDQAAAIGTEFDFFYQDWNKLDSLGKALQSQAPEWTWDSSTTAQLLRGMRPAIEQSYYQALMPTVYALGYYQPMLGSTAWPTDPHAYVSYATDSGGFLLDVKPFGSNYAPYTYPTDPNLYPDPGTQTLWGGRGWWGISRRDTPTISLNAQYSPPTNTFMAHLFLPVARGGLGVYRPAFFEGWPLPRIICDPSLENSLGTGGCDWKRASSPIEALPPTKTRLSIETSSVMRRGDDVTVNLKISNTGSLQADSIDVSQIYGKVIEGSGNISIDGPRVPWSIGALAPGGHAVVTVHLDVPSCVTTFSVTLRGRLKSDSSDGPERFSLRRIVRVE